MTVRRDGEIIRLEGDCGVEDAETLVALLQGDETPTVDLGQCRHAHTAVVQALLSHGAQVSGAPDEPFMRDFVLPQLRSPMIVETQDLYAERWGRRPPARWS
jgi:hypothetical protein